MSEKELLEKITSKFNKEAAESINATYLFQVNEQNYCIKVANNNFEFLSTTPDNPNVTLKADSDTWKSIISGELSAQMAFMMGKLNVSGDMPLALKLPALFSLG